MNPVRKTPISVIILTYNEELNLPQAFESISGWADEIIIVDSFSTDKTLEIAEKYNAKIYKHKFENQARQFNWALDNIPIKNDWIFRLDADEWLTEELKNEITEELRNRETKTSDVPNMERSPKVAARLPTPERSDGGQVGRTSDVQKLEVNGFYIKRRVYFMGRWIRHGGYYPTWILRLFKKGKARSEEREMDEHIILLEGKAGKLKYDFVDENKKSLEDWTAKHNDFSTREARERTKQKNKKTKKQENKLGGQAGNKRWVKNSLYNRLPLFCRAFVYFIYRYFFRLGFLDGKPGLIFHFLQGFWHQFLIDAKIYEKKRYNRKE